MVRSMAPKPIVFAMANPDPEITPDDASRPPRPDNVRSWPPADEAGRDFPNQVNNVLGT
jgi:malate dehydrogenase (oxaloacetate-decarboxylating)(NADP+)